MKRSILTCLTLILLLLDCQNSFATTRYLAAAAHGAGDGSTGSDPMALTAANFTTLETASSAGDTIQIGSSAYPGDITFTDTITVGKSGTLSAGANFTVNTGTDVFTSTAHGLADGDVVKLASTTTLPTITFTENGETVAVVMRTGASWVVRDATTDTFKLALTAGDTALDVTGAGSGTLSWKKRQFISTTCYGSTRLTALKITGSKILPEQNGASGVTNLGSGVPLFSLATGIDNVKIFNMRVDQVENFLLAQNFQNDGIYLKDILINHVREAVIVRGSATCYHGGQTYCDDASAGWIIDNLDGDYAGKRLIRVEMGFHDSTFANDDFDSRYVTTGEFPDAVHFATGSSSLMRSIEYSGGSGSAPTASQTITGGTSAATITLAGVYANPVKGGSVAGWLLYNASSGTLLSGEALSNGSGWSATAVTSPVTSSTTSTASHFFVKNCTSRRAIYIDDGGGYNNGDGFASENSSQYIYYIKCKAFDTGDGGWDLKGGPHWVLGAVTMRDGQHPFRAWGACHLINCFSGFNHQGSVTRFCQAQYSTFINCIGVMTVKKCSFVNNQKFASFDVSSGTFSKLTYTGGSGSVPTEGDQVMGQTTGYTALVYKTYDTTGSGYIAVGNKSGAFQIGETLINLNPETGTHGAWSGTAGNDGVGSITGDLDIQDSIIAFDANHSGVTLTPSGSGTYTTANNDIYDAATAAGTNPQFQNIANLYWDIAGSDFTNPFDYASVGKFINEDKPQVMSTNDFNSALYTSTKGYYNVVTEESKHRVVVSGGAAA